TVPFTFVASVSAIHYTGATPVFVDIDPRTFTMDPAKLEAAITPKTKAIVPVHLYGQPADMDPIMAIAKKHGLLVLEDACQAHGAEYNGKRVGGIGDWGAFSFYPGKNLGAYGDAGAVLTDSDDLAGRLRRLRNWGSERKYHHPELGFNSRLDTLQAVVLSAKLARLDTWNEARRRAAARYDELLADVPGIERPQTLHGNEHVWHLYVIRVPRRDQVLQRLQEEGIGAGIHYPVPLHLHGALSHLGYQPGDFPHAEKAAEEILSLPMYPHLTEEQQERVVEAFRRAVRPR
ncbi:MAG: DegT/DnrJ/EryC1/StrS family aminotransferase, partial [Acidobacteriota bacterium]